MKNVDWFEKEWLKIKESPYYFITTYFKIKDGDKEINFTPNCTEESFNKTFFKFSEKKQIK